MLRGLYTAGTAMIAQNRRMDVITNNLVNVETTGYKQDGLLTQSFEEMLLNRINDPSVYQFQYVGQHNFGIHIDTVYTTFTQGALVETNNPTDMAISGEGYFVIEYTPLEKIQPDEYDLADPEYEPEYELGEPQIRYTRAGNFNINADGYLVTPNGYFVQGEGGSILVGSSDFTVGEDGYIYVGDEAIDKILVVSFEDNSVIRKEGGNLFSVIEDEDGYEYEPDEIVGTVKQGFLEASNVDVASETVRMIECYRAYEINQRMVKMFDESLGKSVNDIAKI